MFFRKSDDKVEALLRKALKTRDVRDRDLLLAYARELNEMVMDDMGDRREPARGSTPSRPVTPEVEAVARRMCLAFHSDWRGDAPTRWEPLVNDQWTDFLVEAQAAVEALLAIAPDPRVSGYLRQAVGGAASADQAPQQPAPAAEA